MLLIGLLLLISIAAYANEGDFVSEDVHYLLRLILSILPAFNFVCPGDSIELSASINH